MPQVERRAEKVEVRPGQSQEPVLPVLDSLPQSEQKEQRGRVAELLSSLKVVEEGPGPQAAQPYPVLPVLES